MHTNNTLYCAQVLEQSTSLYNEQEKYMDVDISWTWKM